MASHSQDTAESDDRPCLECRFTLDQLAHINVKAAGPHPVGELHLPVSGRVKVSYHDAIEPWQRRRFHGAQNKDPAAPESAQGKSQCETDITFWMGKTGGFRPLGSPQ